MSANSPSSVRSGSALATYILRTVVVGAGACALTFVLLGTNPVFVVAALMTVIGLAISLARPLVGFIVYLALIQVIDFIKRLTLAFGDPSPVEWFGIILLPDLILGSVVGGILLSHLWHRPRQLALKYRLVGFVIFLYALWYSVRALWTEAPLLNAIGKWKVAIPYLLCFYIGARLLSDTKALRCILKTLALSVSVAALYGIAQFAFGMTSFEERWLFEGRTILSPDTLLMFDILRPFSSYSDPGTFGYTLAILVTLLLFSRRTFGRAYWNSNWLVGLLLLALASTIVRSAWLLGIVGIMTYLLTKRPREWLGVATAVLLLIAAIRPSLREVRTLQVASSSPFASRAVVTGTYGDRIRGFRNLIDLGIVYSVLGNGVGTTPGSVRDIAGTEVHRQFVAHDYMTESLYEVGWIGFGLLLMIVVLCLRRPTPHFLGSAATGFRVVVVGTLLTAVLFGGSPMQCRPVNTLFWLGLGLLCAVPREQGAGVARHP